MRAVRRSVDHTAAGAARRAVRREPVARAVARPPAVEADDVAHHTLAITLANSAPATRPATGEDQRLRPLRPRIAPTGADAPEASRAVLPERLVGFQANTFGEVRRRTFFDTAEGKWVRTRDHEPAGEGAVAAEAGAVRELEDLANDYKPQVLTKIANFIEATVANWAPHVAVSIHRKTLYVALNS